MNGYAGVAAPPDPGTALTADSLPSPGCSAPASFTPPHPARPITIMGGGNSARALACFLSGQGHEVSLCVRSPEKLKEIADTSAIRASGKLGGTFPLKEVTTNVRACLSDCQTIFVATLASDYPEVARSIAPYLSSDHEVILFSGKFGGALEVSEIFSSLALTGMCVIETDALFHSRIEEDGSVSVRGFKNWTLFSARTKSETLAKSQTVQRFFPNLEPADNIVQRGLTDFGALSHALIGLLNANAIDKGQPFNFYREGLTERTVVLLEALENEFRSIAEAYDTSLLPMPEILNRYYGCSTSSLLNAIKTVPNYRFNAAPATLDHRFFFEDVCCTLVPVRQLAMRAGLATPMTNAVLTMVSTLAQIDLAARARTLDSLGLGGLTYEQIRQTINE